MNPISTFRPLMLAVAISMTACGGGGGGGGAQAPAAPVLTLSADAIKHLSFEWTADSQTGSFELIEDLDGPGPLSGTSVRSLAADARDAELAHVFLPVRAEARYQLLACNGQACSGSGWVSPDTLGPAIGYVKASHHQPGVGERFGEAVALSADGRIMAVGAPHEASSTRDPAQAGVTVNAGAAFVFERGDNGWQQIDFVKPVAVAAETRFGFSIDLSADGSVMLVGAVDDDQTLNNGGAAYVFRRDAAGLWQQEQVLQPPQPLANAQAGAAVALSANGKWAAVSQLSPNRVMIYQHQGDGTWVFAQELIGHNTEAPDRFGHALAMSDDGGTLVVGAPGEQSADPEGDGGTNDIQNPGAAYVFSRGADGTWSQTRFLKSPHPRVQAWFGTSVAVSVRGDGSAVVVVGEPQSTVQQSAHVFLRDAIGQWQRGDSLGATNPGGSGRFGQTVSLSSDGRVLAVGAHEDWNEAVALDGLSVGNNAINSGAAYVFRHQDDGSWSAPALVKAPLSIPHLRFGMSLALSGDGQTLAVHGQDPSNATGVGGNQNDASLPGAGAVYLY